MGLRPPHLTEAAAAVRRIARHSQAVLWALAVVIGAAAGLGSVAFRDAIRAVQRLTFGTDGDRLYDAIAQLPSWRVVRRRRWAGSRSGCASLRPAGAASAAWPM